MIRGGHRVAGTCPCETSGVARFSYVHLSIRCSGRSCASIRVGGVDYAPCGHQTPSGISLIVWGEYLPLRLSDTLYSVATLYRVGFQVQRSRSAMKLEEQSTRVAQGCSQLVSPP